MLTVKPPSRLNGGMLARELEASGYRNVDLTQHDGDLIVAGKTEGGSDIDERSRPKVEAIVAAHEYVPPEERITRLETQLADALTRLSKVEAHPALRARL